MQFTLIIVQYMVQQNNIWFDLKNKIHTYLF